MISIHASAKEATNWLKKRLRKEWISIHASAKEATAKTASMSVPVLYFNPRFREGSDFAPFTHAVFPDISIHASAKEATKGSPNAQTVASISIHASAKEATIPILPFIPTRKFQSTLPRRKRRRSRKRKQKRSTFQSTLPRRKRL